MPLAAAIAGAAIIGGGASIISANKASSTAASTATANNALQSQIYGENKATLAPYVATGNQASAAINALLGLGGSTSSTGGTGSTAGTVDWGAYVRGNPDALADYEKYHSGQDINSYGQYHYAADGSKRDLTPYTTGATTAASSTDATTAANAAYDNYKNSTEYQSRLAQGQNSVVSALGSKGLLDSGAALKGLTKYGQTFASNDFQTYLGNLTNQQQVGLSAAAAQAGVSTGYANSVSANNTAAANTTSNAALSNASTINSALGNIVSGIGYSQGLGSSYGSSSGTNAYGIKGAGNIY